VTTPDQDTQAESDSIFGPTYRTLTLGIIAVITVAAFEGMAVITAMPVVVADLDGLVWYAWTFTAFVAPSLYAMVVAGEAADRRGPLRPLLLGLGLFGLGTLVAGLANGIPVLLLGRAVQGLGFGAVIVALYVVIGKVYPEAMRPRIFTAMSGAWVLPGILGPVVAGTIADTVGWRWVFLGVLALLVPITAVLVPSMLGLDLPGDPAARPVGGRKRRALMAALGVGLLQLAGQLLDGTSVLLVVPALVLLGLSVPHLLPQGALRLRRGLPTVVMMRGFLAGAFFGAEAFVPLLLINERDLSTATAGAALTGGALGWFVGSWYQGRPSTELPRWRLVQIGSGLVTFGILTSTLVLIPAVPAMLVMVTWTAGAVGMGLLYGSLGVLLLQLSPPEEQGVNSAALQIADSLGVVACTGLAGVIFAAGHTVAGKDADVFAVIFALMAVVAGGATLVAPRVRPNTVAVV